MQISDYFLIRKIKIFNHNFFKKKRKTNNKILICEFSHNSITQVAFSYLVNAIAERQNCKIFAYLDISKFSFFYSIKFFLYKLLNYNYGNFAVFKSFNVNNFIFLKITIQSKIKTTKVLKKLNLKKKEDLLHLKVEGILIGDLIYDTYLKDTGFPTLNINDIKLNKFIFNKVCLFYFWLDFLKKKNVVGVVVSDTVYTSSMITRISCRMKIPTYQCNWNNIVRITSKNFHANSQFNYYKKYFKDFSFDEKKMALKISKDKIKIRLSGKKGVDDLHYTINNLWRINYSKKRVLKNTIKKKILIVSHCFIDAPHAYGPDSNIFPDFYEWLNFLSDLSKETDFEWYIKPHPDSSLREDQIFADYIKNNQNFIEVPKYCSNLQLINEKIDCVLTVYGTAAWEYAYHKIPVITAGKFNPYMNYDFCAYALNKSVYNYMIKNFKKLKINYSKKNIHEFYFMHNIFSRSDWMISDYEKLLKEIKGYKNLSKIEFYKYWIDSFNSKKFLRINEYLNKFLNSNDLLIKNYKKIN
jgi:hypothetical protein